MNIKQLESTAKALAPVIRSCVDKAVATLRGDVTAWLDDAVKALENRLNTRVDAVKQAIPAQDTGEKLTQDAVAEMIATAVNQEREANKQATETLWERTQQAIEEAAKNTRDTVSNEAAEALEAVKQAIPVPVTPETLNPDQIKALVCAKFDEFKAGLAPPRDGIDGKDASQIELLPEVDFSKSYPRGTHAIHNGGEIRAYQQTTGEKGWEVVKNGIADVQIEQKDPRNWVIRVLQTNGKMQETAVAIPAMVYRNVYREGEHYQKGDTVTWGGSLWHADQDGPGKPGAADSGWTMAAKKGRDGKNAGAN